MRSRRLVPADAADLIAGDFPATGGIAGDPLGISVAWYSDRPADVRPAAFQRLPVLRLDPFMYVAFAFQSAQVHRGRDGQGLSGSAAAWRKSGAGVRPYRHGNHVAAAVRYRFGAGTGH